MVEAEVVLADGSIVIVNEKEHEGEAKQRLDLQLLYFGNSIVIADLI